MKRINELIDNNELKYKISLLEPRVLHRFTSSMINFYNESWEVCDIIFDTTYEIYKPGIDRDLLYNYFDNICKDMNIKGKDCNYDVYDHMSKLLGVSNYKDII